MDDSTADEAATFAYLGALDRNVAEYTRGGVAPAGIAAAGTAAVDAGAKDLVISPRTRAPASRTAPRRSKLTTRAVDGAIHTMCEQRTR